MCWLISSIINVLDLHFKLSQIVSINVQHLAENACYETFCSRMYTLTTAKQITVLRTKTLCAYWCKLRDFTLVLNILFITTTKHWNKHILNTLLVPFEIIQNITYIKVLTLNKISTSKDIINSYHKMIKQHYVDNTV